MIKKDESRKQGKVNNFNYLAVMIEVFNFIVIVHVGLPLIVNKRILAAVELLTTV